MDSKYEPSLLECDELLIKALNLDGKGTYSSSEDCLEFTIYTRLSALPAEAENNELSNVNTLNDSFSIRLRYLQDAIIKHCEQFTKDYIWQKSPITIQFISKEFEKNQKSIIRFAHGFCHFGDNINDEWFIVLLLVELSRKFPFLVIETQDSDGQFLLIECAEYLPSWLKPEVALNRILLHTGDMHIISLKQSRETPAFEQAVEWVLDPNTPTLASNSIQEHFRAKLLQMKSKPNLHSSRVRIPREIAGLLTRCPQLIAPVVEAIYTRDPISMQFCEKMERFSPNAADFVDCSVLFTRCLFAQAASIKFAPTAPFHSIPLQTSGEVLGMKLMCGFEILFQDPMFRKKDWPHTPGVTLKAHMDRLLSLSPITSSELKSAPSDSEEWMKVTDSELESWKIHPSSTSSLEMERERLKTLFKTFGEGESEFDGIHSFRKPNDIDSSDSDSSSNEGFSDSDTTDNVDDLDFELFNMNRFMMLLNKTEASSISSKEQETSTLKEDATYIEDTSLGFLDEVVKHASEGNERTQDREGEEDEKLFECLFNSIRTEMGNGPVNTLLASMDPVSTL